MKLSPQQDDFVQWAEHGDGSCVLEAVAGAGKTTTLITAIERMSGHIAILAYNKKIAEEIKVKLKERGVTHADAGTVHSFGFKAYRKAYPRVNVDGKKLSQIANQMFATKDIEKYSNYVVKLVSLAKQKAVGVSSSIHDQGIWWDIARHFDVFDNGKSGDTLPEHEIIQAAIQLLVANNKTTAVIDFDDMVYMPLVLRLPFWQYDVVMVDEAQDTNPARRLMVKQMVKRGGRFIAVGDRHQAIYGFTGADNDSLDLIAREFNCVRMPLTTTYRCPKAVVAFAQQWVSHIHAHGSAPEGSVSRTSMADFIMRNDLNKDSAVLCRNTKPLVALALSLIRNRIACKVEGRDIGANLKKLINRWKVKSLNALSDKLDKYLSKELERLNTLQQDAKAQIVEDTVETVKVIIDQCLKEGKTSLVDAVEYIDMLFADDVSGVMVLSTIHKSKGREWERVFWLDRAGTCPSKYAKQQWMKDQERNLMYVAATRAKDELIELEGEVNKEKAVRRGRAVTEAGPTVADQPATSARPGKSDEQRKADKRERARKRREAKEKSE